MCYFSVIMRIFTEQLAILSKSDSFTVVCDLMSVDYFADIEHVARSHSVRTHTRTQWRLLKCEDYRL